MPRPSSNAITGEEQGPVPVLVQIPVSCPQCKSTKRTKLENVETIDAEVTVNEVTYNRVTWSRTSCALCGHRYRVKTYGFIPVPKQEEPKEEEPKDPANLIPRDAD